MSARAIARMLSALVAVLVLLQPFIRMAYSVDPSPKHGHVLTRIDNQNPADREIAIESADHPSESAAPIRRARINCETVRDYLAALREPATLVSRLAAPVCDRLNQHVEFVSFEYFAARMHETRGKPQLTVSISLPAEWVSEVCRHRGFKLCQAFDDSSSCRAYCAHCS